jgi:ubiquinone biosynthesis protein UbiJ
VTEETENLILRLLREIRADVADVRDTQRRHGERMTTLDRRMVDVQESVALAVGFAVSSNAHYETNAERIDRLNETVEALRARVEKLEEKA